MPASWCWVLQGVQVHQETMLLHQGGLGQEALRVPVLQPPDLHFGRTVPPQRSLHEEQLLRTRTRLRDTVHRASAKLLSP